MPTLAVAALVAAAAALVVALGLAVHFWRKRSDLQALLVEGASRYEELRVRHDALSRDAAREGDRARQTQSATTRLETALAEAREQTTVLTRRLETRETEWRLDREKIDHQRHLLERHLERLMEQQRQVEARDAEAAEGLAAAKAEAAARERQLQSEAGHKVRELTDRLRAAERAREDAEARARKAAATATPATPAVDPVEMTKLKRRLAQSERLYAGMRGLREMADERNKNWEVALRRLARHIVTEAGVPETAVPTTLGPLVGMALQKIGATLGEDLPSGQDGGDEPEAATAEPATGTGTTAAGSSAAGSSASVPSGATATPAET